VPRVAGRADVASATRRPWIDSNGWRFVRQPTGKFYYDLTEKEQGKPARPPPKPLPIKRTHPEDDPAGFDGGGPNAWRSCALCRPPSLPPLPTSA